MDIIGYLGLGFSVALDPINILYCFIGVLLGTLVGVLPGIGPTATIAMLLPITFSLSPAAALIIGVVIFFGATIRGLGFVPVVFIGSFGSAMASRLNSPLFAALLAVTLTVMCTLIFVVGLGMSVSWFGPWLGQ